MPRKREKKVECRMSDEEMEKYNTLLNKSKLNKQEYNLKCLLQKKIVVIEGINELALQIRKIGVNINQIAHLANESKYINHHQLEEVNNRLNDIWVLLTDFVKKSKL